MLTILYFSLFWISLIGLCVWISRYLAILRSAGSSPHLDENSYKRPPADPPFVSILIPARNEERNIRECLESLTRQDYPNYEIIVVNDRSTDRTREIVEELQKTHRNIALITNEELQEGWTGKNFALHKGVQSAKGAWYLFTDADTWHHPKSVSQAVNYVLDKKADMLTLLPFLEGKSFWEKLIQPIAGAVLLISFPIKNSNNPRKKTAFANGQFILIRKDIYNKFGGHKGLKEHFLEDIAMAKAVKHGGDVLSVVISPDLFKTRMYKNFMEIWNGWTRIFYYIYDKKFWLIFANIVLLFVFSLLPIVLFVYCGARLMMENEFSNRTFAIFVLSALQIIVIRLTTFRYCRMSRSNPYYSMLNPIGYVIMIGILLNAIKTIFSKKGMTWRGTTYAKN